MQGDLQVMTVADLIQHNCQDGKTACLTINRNGQQAAIFFKEGNVVHAVLDNNKGEEVVYEILAWEDGQFTLEMGKAPPTTTIKRSWSGLLLEGARRLDESVDETINISTNNSITENQEEILMAAQRKTKSGRLAEALEELLVDSSDITGAAVVGTDGLVYSANVPQKGLDVEMVGATSAAVLGLSNRSVKQLKRGNFKQTLIQGDDGNLIVVGLNDETLLVGLTPSNVNLGMAFAEVRAMVDTLSNIL